MEFKSQKKYRKHFSKSHKEQCLQCDKFFISKFSLESHIEIEHPVYKKQIEIPKRCTILRYYDSYADSSNNVNQSDNNYTVIDMAGSHTYTNVDHSLSSLT